MNMKKGQAAMEFLMTYGWAILVVIAAIAALAYFGVLSPDKMLPERTTFQAPVPSVDNAVVRANGTVVIAFKNNVGFPITIDGVTASGSCTTPTFRAVYNSTSSQTTTGMTIYNGDGFRIEFTCGALTAGQKFNSDVVLTYTNTESDLQKPHSGSISARVA
ncbi:MAG: hypothetical protein V1859_07315 [archaeon]